MHQIRPPQRTFTASITLKFPVNELPTSAAGFGWHGLCTPSMGRNQKGFKSPVYRMNIEEQKKLLAMKSTTRSQLRKGDRPWGGRLWESCQAMNKKLIRGRQSGKRWHNTPKFHHSALEVNETLGQWRFLLLSGETSSACGGVLRFSAAVSNGCRDWRGVSRGHSSRKTSRSAERTVKLPDGLTRRRTEPMTGNRLRKSSTTTNPPKEE